MFLFIHSSKHPPCSPCSMYNSWKRLVLAVCISSNVAEHTWPFCTRDADCAEAALHLLQLLAHLAVELAGPQLKEVFSQAGGSADQVHGAQLKKKQSSLLWDQGEPTA